MKNLFLFSLKLSKNLHKCQIVLKLLKNMRKFIIKFTLKFNEKFPSRTMLPAI